MIRHVAIFQCVLIGVALSGCAKKTDTAPPAPEAIVAQVISKRITDWDEFNSRLLVGEPTVAPRTVDCPIRMPMPPAANQGSIYENQTALQRRYFEPTPVAVPRQST